MSTIDVDTPESWVTEPPIVFDENMLPPLPPVVATGTDSGEWDDALVRIIELLRSPGNRIRNKLLFLGLPQLGFIYTPGTLKEQRDHAEAVKYWSKENRQQRRLDKKRRKGLA